MGEGYSSCYQIKVYALLQRRDIYEIVKMHLRNLNIFFSRTTRPISTKFSTMYRWVKGINVSINEGPRYFPRGNNYEIVEIY